MNEIKWDNTAGISPTNKNVHYNAGILRAGEITRHLEGCVVKESDLTPGINYFENHGFRFGQTAYIDVQPIASTDQELPQPGIIQFAKDLGIRQDQLVMPKLDRHTNKVLLVNSQKELKLERLEGRSVGFNLEENNTFIDSLIIQETEQTKDIVLAITGADCPSVVGRALLDTGDRVIFGIHAGRKGCLGGIVENTAEKLKVIGVLPGTVQLAVGPGGQALELPLETIEQEAALNLSSLTQDLWHKSSVISYSTRTDRKTMVIYDNQADVIRRTTISFNNLLASDGLSIIDANTVTSDRLKSYRAMTIAANSNNEVLKRSKIGRNALFTRFY